MPTVQEKRECLQRRASYTRASLIRSVVAQLTISGWLAMTLPGVTANIPTSYRNQFRSCAGRLASVGISSEAASMACAESLRPSDLSLCVAQIDRRTEIEAGDALATCRQVRRPNELATCVVGISRNNGEIAVPGVLNYCGRSLLPENFAQCVVGLRREIDVTPTQAMESCISATDRLTGEFLPTFVPGNQTPVQPAPSAPNVLGDPTTLTEPNPAPINAPGNPGGI